MAKTLGNLKDWLLSKTDLDEKFNAGVGRVKTQIQQNPQRFNVFDQAAKGRFNTQTFLDKPAQIVGKIGSLPSKLAFGYGKQMVKDAPSIGKSMFKTLPPVQAYNSVFNKQNLAKPEDVYNSLKGVGYVATPGMTFAGGLFNTGLQSLTQLKKPTMEDYQAGLSRSAALGPLSKITALTPLGKLAPTSTKPLGRVLQAGKIGATREGVEGLAEGAMRPLNKDENRLGAMFSEALYGAGFGSVLGTGGQLTKDLPEITKALKNDTRLRAIVLKGNLRSLETINKIRGMGKIGNMIANSIEQARKNPNSGMVNVGEGIEGAKKTLGIKSDPKLDYEGQAQFLKDSLGLDDVQTKDALEALSGTGQGGVKMTMDEVQNAIVQRTKRDADEMLAKLDFEDRISGQPKIPTNEPQVKNDPYWVSKELDKIEKNRVLKLKEQTPLKLNENETVDTIVSSLKKNGKTVEAVGKDLESGVKNEDTNRIKQFFDYYKKKSEADTGIKYGTRENYFTHLSKERIDDILSKPSTPDTFGTIVSEPYFAKKRTGKLTDYEISERALMAYEKEAMKNSNLSELQKNELKLGSDIVDASKNTDEPKIDIVAKVEEYGLKTGEGKTYKDNNKSTFIKLKDTAFRSLDDRVARVKDQEFYNDFLDPFKKAQKQLGEFAEQNNNPEQIFREMQKLQKEASNTFLNNVKNSDIKQGHLRELVNEISEQYIVKDIRQKGLAKKVMAQVRGMTGRGALGLNFASAINNIFETKRIASSVSTKSMAKATKRFINGEDLAVKYGVDKMDTALERKGMGKVFEKIDKGLFYMFDKTEKIKDNLMLLALEEQGIEKGFKDEELRRYVQKKFSTFAIKYGKGQDIGLYQSDLTKTLLQFGQYAIKDVVLALDKVSGAIKGDTGDIKYLAKYGVLSALQMMAFKAVLDTTGFGGSTGTPYDFVSGLISKGGASSPIITLAKDLYEEVQSDDGESAYDKSKRRKSLLRTGMVMGVPASNQLYFKSGQYLKARNKGYYETYAGNVAGPVGTSTADTIKGTMFGPSYDSKRNKYIQRSKDQLFPALKEKESEYYRSQPKGAARENYYNEVQTSRDQGKKEKIARTSLEDSKDKEKKVGNVILYKKENGYIDKFDLTTDDGKKGYNYARMKSGDIKPGYEEDGYVYSQTKSGTNTRTETKLTVDPPEYTGNPLLDKQIKQEYKGAISSKENDILRLFQLKYLTEEEAIKALAELEQSGQGYGVGVTKPKKTSITRTKITSNFKPMTTFKLGSTPKFKIKNRLKKFKFA